MAASDNRCVVSLRFEDSLILHLEVYGFVETHRGQCLCSLRYAECTPQYDECRPSRLSYRNGLSEDPVAELGVQRFFCYNFHAAVEKLLQIENETRREPRASTWANIYEQIKITIVFCFSACYGAKHPNVDCTVMGSDASYVFSFLVYSLFSNHESLSIASVTDALYRFRQWAVQGFWVSSVLAGC